MLPADDQVLVCPVKGIMVLFTPARFHWSMSAYKNFLAGWSDLSIEIMKNPGQETIHF